MNIPFNIIYLSFVFLLANCGTESQNNSAVNSAPIKAVVVPIPEKEPIPESFDRQAISKNLSQKIKDGTPLFIHVMVPLCDNENQGIVRVNEKLGDGQNLRTNLYWGALYGIRTHFNKSKKWQKIDSQKNINDVILERVVFYRAFDSSTKVYMIADAYRGDKMKDCMEDYFDAMAGVKSNEININDQNIGIYGNSDLLIFNGHNGLMDMDIETVRNKDNRAKDVAVIGCVSYNYFAEHLKHAKGYPLLTTTNLMAPEAYVMEALVNNWAQLKSGSEIRKAVGLAYHKYQKCGVKGATRLFKTGWDE